MNITLWNSVVRWSECDAAGIIYHARVLDWFSEARIQWLEEHGLSYYEMLRPIGLELLVKSAELKFHHALKPGDEIHLEVAMDEMTATRVSFSYRVGVPGRPRVLALGGRTEHAFVLQGRACRLDRTRPDLFRQFEQNR